MYIPPFAYRFIHRWTQGYCHIRAIVNTVNMDIQVSLRELAINSFGYITRSGIAGSFVSSTLIKKKNYTILHFNQQYIRVPNSHSFLFFFFLVVAFLIGVKCYVTVVLIFISLMIRDFKHLFTCYWSFLFLFGDMSIHVFCLYLN